MDSGNLKREEDYPCPDEVVSVHDDNLKSMPPY